LPTPRARFTAAIFDMDGLLLDSERAIMESWQQAAREFGAELKTEHYLQLIGRRGADVRTLFRSILPEGFPFDEARARARVLSTERRAREGFLVKPGVQQLLARLAQHAVPAAVASSTHRDEVERRLSMTQLHSQFAAITGGDEVQHGKPAPDIFLLAAERLGVEPQQCVVFEDVEHGAHGALAAGMQVVIVPDLKQPSPDIQIRCLAVLPTLEHVEHTFVSWFVG